MWVKFKVIKSKHVSSNCYFNQAVITCSEESVKTK